MNGGDKFERLRKSNCIGMLGARGNSWRIHFYQM